MIKKTLFICAASLFVAACEGSRVQDLSVDYGSDAKGLEQLKAGIWVDPNGCEHWIIDDGIEGYLSQRLQPNGKPVCGNTLPAGTVVGDFKRGSTIADIF